MKNATRSIVHKIAKTALVSILLFGVLFLSLPHVVSMSPGGAAPPPFADVDPADWFYEQVRHVFEHNLMVGAGDMTFSPHISVTRGMAVQVIYNHSGRPSTAWMTNPFTDVAEDAWYRDAVVWAAARGIVQGSGDGTFAPGEYITRAHLTLILNNYADFARLDLPVQRESQPFADYMDIRNYAKEAIDRFFQAMVINGRPDGTFGPQDSATRAELATMLSQFVRYSERLPIPTPVPPYGIFDPPPVPPYGVFPSPTPIPPGPEYGFPYSPDPDDSRPAYGFPACLD